MGNVFASFEDGGGNNQALREASHCCKLLIISSLKETGPQLYSCMKQNSPSDVNNFAVPYSPEHLEDNLARMTP